ncbi:MAG TPA: hypothetical protein VFA33_03215 [Bryobacteraceae bacterium]|nr:hypothetical protein [Bryobacteraceae bacterium]
MVRILLAGWLVVVPLAGQNLEIHSEFLRVDPRGEVLLSDQTPEPRELLSPALVRNGFASFHIVVRAERANYFLFVGTNPPGELRTSVYKEEFAEVNGAWIPDALKPVRLPDFGVLPDPEAAIPGQTARAYLLDIWAPPETPPGRLRLEIQLKAGGWTIWPMELRILPAVVPEARRRSRQPLPAIDRPSDEAAADVLLEFLESRGKQPAAREEAPDFNAPGTLREVVRRNAEQDLTLAGSLDVEGLIPRLKQQVAANGGGSEWYLHVRDLIYRLCSAEAPGRP